MVNLVGGLAPDVGADEVEGPGIPGIPGDLMLRVIMAESHISPRLQVQLSSIDDSAPVISPDMAKRVLSLDLEMRQQDLVFLRPLRNQCGRIGGQNGFARDGEDAEVELGVHQSTRLVCRHIDGELLE